MFSNQEVSLMKLEEAIEYLKPFINRPFGEFLSEKQLQNIRTDKGLTGKLLELQIGLNNTTKNLDFEDGELKTNKVDRDGTPLETMFIKQLSNIVDEVIRAKEFYETELYHKVKNILYVPVYKGNRKIKLHRTQWQLLPYIHVNMDNPAYSKIISQLEKDYYSISEQIIYLLNQGSNSTIHTCNGHFIQIRTKDCKPYTP